MENENNNPIEQPIENSNPVQQSGTINNGESTNVAIEEQKGFSIASMILGIVAIMFCCINAYVAIICGILAIVFSVIGKKKGGKGMATTGLILGIIALSLYALMIILGATAIVGIMSGIASSI